IFGIDDFNGGPASGVVKITIPEEMEETITLSRIREIIMEHKGDTPVVITAAASNKKYKTKSDLWVNPSDRFIQKLSDLIGKENIG
ncbi:MAG TPA: hypothetical protein VM577_01315, partial [Anaerovoracaceae bacterium]|nr:hypothetical protein [Anaerovoracaceae bacterium]